MHRPGRGTTSGRPSAAAPCRRSLAKDAVRRHAAAEDDVRAPVASRPQGLRREHVDDGVLEAQASSATVVAGQPRPVDLAPVLGGRQRVRDLAPRRGLQAAEREVERVAQPGAREAPVAVRRASRRGHDRRPARVRQPEQPADLVEGLAGRVVDRLAEQAVLKVVGHLDEERVAAADDERDERELRCRLLGLVGVEQPGGVDVALEVVDRHQRQAVRARPASWPS